MYLWVHCSPVLSGQKTDHYWWHPLGHLLSDFLLVSGIDWLVRGREESIILSPLLPFSCAMLIVEAATPHDYNSSALGSLHCSSKSPWDFVTLSPPAWPFVTRCGSSLPHWLTLGTTPLLFTLLHLSRRVLLPKLHCTGPCEVDSLFSQTGSFQRIGLCHTGPLLQP